MSFLAQEILRASGTPTRPVDPFSLSTAWGLEITEGRLQGGLGMAIPGRPSLGGPDGRIVLDETQPWLNKRIICAHEMGHDLLFFPDWFEALGTASVGNEESVREEEICDLFALALLIPLRILDEVKRLRSAADLTQLAKEYDVPSWALLLRLAQLRVNLPFTALLATRRGPDREIGFGGTSSEDHLFVLASTTPAVVGPGDSVGFSASAPDPSLQGLPGIARSLQDQNTVFYGDAVPALEWPGGVVFLGTPV